MQKKDRFAISSLEVAQLNSDGWELTQLGDFYLTALMRRANELGLAGKKIKDICRIDPPENGQIFIDFILE